MGMKIVEPVTVPYAEQELTIPEVGVYGEKYGAELMQEVEECGLRIVGPWVFVSYSVPKNGKDRYRAELCLPIAVGDAYVGRRFSVKSPGRFSCASFEYNWKLRQLFTKGYQSLVRETIAEEMRFTSESREVYHAWFGPNSLENRIEIQIGVA